MIFFDVGDFYMTKTRWSIFHLTICLTAVLLLSFSLSACGKRAPKKAAPYDGKDYIEISELTQAGENPLEAADALTPVHNYDSQLSVPTYVTKVDDTWFIVDCYHNRVIYSDDMGAPLTDWYIMCSEATQPHTMASDGTVYMIEDTENNRVLIYEKTGDKFINTQAIYDIGSRPHFTAYDEISDTFYVWSSVTGELYCFRHTSDSARVYLTEIKKIEELAGLYVRSFTIKDGDIYFVSGVSSDGATGRILKCDLKTLSIEKSYPVPNELAGMVQITPIDDMYYITVSTDLYGNQDYATLIRTKSLEDLSAGKYEDIYSQYFIGGGTPYNISQVDDTYFLTEHRLKDHSIWSFKVSDKNVVDVTSIY